MPIPANQIRTAEITMYGLIAGSGSNAVNTVTVFHYRRLAISVTPTKAALDTVFQAGPMAPVIAALNARWTQLRNSIRWLDDAQDGPVDFTHVNPGAIATDAMTSNETVYMRMRTALRGRSFRGSKFFGPISEADTTLGASDVLNAGAITRFQAIATALGLDLTDATGNVWRLAIVSRKLSQLLVNPTNVIFNDVTQIALNTRVGDMKRRKVHSVY